MSIELYNWTRLYYVEQDVRMQIQQHREELRTCEFNEQDEIIRNLIKLQDKKNYMIPENGYLRLPDFAMKTYLDIEYKDLIPFIGENEGCQFPFKSEGFQYIIDRAEYKLSQYLIENKEQIVSDALENYLDLLIDDDDDFNPYEKELKLASLKDIKEDPFTIDLFSDKAKEKAKSLAALHISNLNYNTKESHLRYIVMFFKDAQKDGAKAIVWD